MNYAVAFYTSTYTPHLDTAVLRINMQSESLWDERLNVFTFKLTSVTKKGYSGSMNAGILCGLTSDLVELIVGYLGFFI